jgi:hypothetical protein
VKPAKNKSDGAPGSAASDPADPVVVGATIGSAVLGLVLIIVTIVLLYDRKNNGGVGVFRRRSIRKNGVAASAKVLDQQQHAHATGRGVIVLWKVDLVVEVQPKEGAPFRASSRLMVSGSEARLMHEGAYVPVFYDPSDRTVIVDIDTIRARQEGAVEDRERAAERRRAELLAGKPGDP